MAEVLNLVVEQMPDDQPLWMLLLLLALALPCRYFLITAHAQVLAGLDDARARTWQLLWKLLVASLLVLLVGLGILFLVPVLAVILLVTDAIGVLILAVAELVTLYHTAQVFRDGPDQTPPPQQKEEECL